MRIEVGHFDQPPPSMTVPPRARVIAEATDFPRLQLREYETGSQLSPCLAWCHESVGPGYEAWALVPLNDRDVIYFGRVEDAEQFWTLYGASPPPARQPLPRVPLAA